MEADCLKCVLCTWWLISNAVHKARQLRQPGHRMQAPLQSHVDTYKRYCTERQCSFFPRFCKIQDEKKSIGGKKVAFSCLAWGWLLIGELCFPPQRLRMLHVQHWVASLLCAHWPLKFTVYSDYYIFLFFLLLYFNCPNLSWCTTLLNNVGMLYPLAHRRRWPVPRHCFGLSSSIHCDIYSYLCDSLRSMKRAKLVVTSHHITASATATASAVAAQLALRIRVLCYI